MITMMLNWLSGSVLDRLLLHAERRLNSAVEHKRIGAQLAAEEIRAIDQRSEVGVGDDQLCG